MSSITGIIPFSFFRGNQKPAGSSFLRVDALTNNTPDFEKWQHGKYYDNLIFQKAYWKEMMELFEGPMILDICDPDWIKNGIEIKKIGDMVHAITCSSKKLTLLLKNYFPDKIVRHVPDRLDLNYYPEQRGIHCGPAKSAVWFGFIHNAYETLEKFAPLLKQHNIRLIIIANLPYSKNDTIADLIPEYHSFDHSTAYSLIKTADIVLNPKSELAFFKYKSNNKSLIGWILGLPVAETTEDLERLLSAEERNKQVLQMQPVVRADYDIHQSAEQYREIIQLIRDTYF